MWVHSLEQGSDRSQIVPSKFSMVPVAIRSNVAGFDLGMQALGHGTES